MNWGNTSLRMEYSYEEGYVTTAKGTKVRAYQFIEDSLSIELFDRYTKMKIEKPASYFEQFKFDLSYNCFGYCFANSSVFLPDPTIFLEEEYEEVDRHDAEYILFKQFKEFSDQGGEVHIFSHAAKVLPNGNVSFKPGINALVENVDIRDAIFTYNLNHATYFKKKVFMQCFESNKAASNDWMNLFDR